MDTLSVVGDLVHHHRGDKTLSASACEVEQYEPEWCSLTCLGPPHPVVNIYGNLYTSTVVLV